MASFIPSILSLFSIVLFLCSISLAQDRSQLSLRYYAKTCPDYERIVRAEMECAVHEDPRNAAAMLRLHFHDCFVQVRAIRFRSSTWDVPVGRKDSKTASLEMANADLPAPNQALAAHISKFLQKGLSVTDLVALSGAHTIGMARCASFRDRIYGDFQLTSRFNPFSELYLSKLRSTCPLVGSDDNTTPLDSITPILFDNAYFESILKGDSLLNSDQQLYSSIVGVETAELVKKYAVDPIAFFIQFSDSMVKLGNITNPVGGEVRSNVEL